MRLKQKTIKMNLRKGLYKSTYFRGALFWSTAAAIHEAAAIDEGDPPLCESRQPLSLFVAAKHNSRDIKINLKLILQLSCILSLFM